MSEAHIAFQKFQAALQPIVKTATVKVQGNRGNYEFKYATLDAIIEHIKPLMAEHGLFFVQATDFFNGGSALKTEIYHASEVEPIFWAHLPVPNNLTPQQLGSTLTYYKRYQLAALVGLATEDDDDANIAEGNVIQSKKSGKLNRTDLVKRMRKLYEELKTVETLDGFNMLLQGERAMIDQFKLDLEKEWYGPVEEGQPWETSIFELRDKLDKERVDDF